MPVLPIMKYGNSVLASAAEEVKNIDDEIRELAQNMVQTMYAAPGLGLAAPQVNVSKRVITVDISVGENEKDLIILINPELLRAEGEIISEEGCLSVPGIHENVSRPVRVVIKGLDLDGQEKIIEADDLLARVFCHEIDHINGKLFIEHLSSLKRALVRRKLKKQAELEKDR